MRGVTRGGGLLRVDVEVARADVDEDGRRAGVDDTFAVAGQVSEVVMTSSPGPTPSATSARCIAAVAEETARTCSAPEVLRGAPLELGRAGPGREPAGAHRLGDRGDLLLADRRRLEAEHRGPPLLRPVHAPKPNGRPRAAASSGIVLRQRAEPALQRRDVEADRRSGRVRAGERLVPRGADGQHRAGAIRADAERLEAMPRRAIHPHPPTPGSASASATPSTARSSPTGGTRKRVTPPPGAHGLEEAAAPSPSAAATVIAFSGAPVTASTSSASWPPPSRAASSTTRGPSAPTTICVYAGPSASPIAAAAASASASGLLGVRRRVHVCERDAEGLSPRSRSVTASGTNRPRRENDTTVTSCPSTSSSTITAPPRDASRAAATAASTSSARRTTESPRCPCRSGAFTTQGSPTWRSATAGSSSRPSVAQRGCATPASPNRARCRVFDVASCAARGVSGCGSSSFAATRAAMATGQSIPGATIPSTCSARASCSIASSSSVDTSARRSASAKPIAAGSRSSAITTTSSRAAAASRSPSCAGPAPRTRRRFVPAAGPTATRPRSPGTSARCARARRRSSCAPASP